MFTHSALKSRINNWKELRIPLLAKSRRKKLSKRISLSSLTSSPMMVGPSTTMEFKSNLPKIIKVTILESCSMLKLLWISEEKKNKLKLTKVDWMISLN